MIVPKPFPSASKARKPKVACLGHDIYFENHYCEKSTEKYDVGWFSFDHFSGGYYKELTRFRPDVTLVFRPELHDGVNVKSIPGLKIGFSTEPMPKISNGAIQRSSETDRRMRMLEHLNFQAFDAVYHYDQNSSSFAQSLGLRFSGFHRIPINTDLFHPFNKPPANWDVVFVGKATQRRIEILQILKSYNLTFLWIEHGISGKSLAEVFRRSKCILNIHADDITALEPRVYLAAACGVPVLSDPYGNETFPMDDYVRVMNMTDLSVSAIRSTISEIGAATKNQSPKQLSHKLRMMSTEHFVGRLINKFT